MVVFAVVCVFVFVLVCVFVFVFARLLVCRRCIRKHTRIRMRMLLTMCIIASSHDRVRVRIVLTNTSNCSDVCTIVVTLIVCRSHVMNEMFQEFW